MRSIAELKSSILQSVAETDDAEILNSIMNYIAQVKSSKASIVAYDSKGKPLTVADYQARIEEAREQYLQNKVVTQDAMEKRSI